MLRFAEIGFFLLPFALFAVWWVLGKRATLRVLLGAAVVVVALAAVTVKLQALAYPAASATRIVPLLVSSENPCGSHGEV